MKIGVISDTHDRRAGIDEAFEIFEREAVDLIVHCGDWTHAETLRYFAGKAAHLGVGVRGVLGNNDLQSDAFLQIASEKVAFKLTEGVLRFKTEGRKVAVYHGHHKPTLHKLLGEELDLVCLGHSHKPRYDRLNDKVILNPGSTAFAIPRSKAWHGSVAIYNTKTHEAEFKYFQTNTDLHYT